MFIILNIIGQFLAVYPRKISIWERVSFTLIRDTRDNTDEYAAEIANITRLYSRLELLQVIRNTRSSSFAASLAIIGRVLETALAQNRVIIHLLVGGKNWYKGKEFLNAAKLATSRSCRYFSASVFVSTGCTGYVCEVRSTEKAFLAWGRGCLSVCLSASLSLSLSHSIPLFPLSLSRVVPFWILECHLPPWAREST